MHVSMEKTPVHALLYHKACTVSLDVGMHIHTDRKHFCSEILRLQSLQTILDNPNSAFATDPNGFIIVTGPAQSAAQMEKVCLSCTVRVRSKVQQ